MKSYLEVNDLYLLNAPEESENPYVSTYMNDRILDDCIAKQFSISNNTRGIQFFGFSKSELEKMKQSLSDGQFIWIKYYQEKKYCLWFLLMRWRKMVMEV